MRHKTEEQSRSVPIPVVALLLGWSGVMPFIAADLLLLALLVVFPGLVLWLPTLIRG